jgi:hypothetical protein
MRPASSARRTWTERPGASSCARSERDAPRDDEHGRAAPEFIAGLAAERARLRVAQVMRVGWLATADEAWLLGDRAKVLPVSITPWCGNSGHGLVVSGGLVAIGTTRRSLLTGNGCFGRDVADGGHRSPRQHYRHKDEVVLAGKVGERSERSNPDDPWLACTITRNEGRRLRQHRQHRLRP